jgi:hypothetical protein
MVRQIRQWTQSGAQQLEREQRVRRRARLSAPTHHQPGGHLVCSRLYTNTAHGFGTYQWQIDHRLDTLDPNVVLGLFLYTGPSGYNEIDIE